MRRAAALAIVAGLWLAATPALAAKGVNLSWSRCAGEGLGTSLRTFACDTNAGAEQLVVSFVLDAPLAQVQANEVVIDLVSQDDPLPAWWDFKDVGTCRMNSLSINLVEDPGDVVCNYWQGTLPAGGVGSYNGDLGIFPPDVATRHRRLKIALAVQPNELATLTPDVEYFSCNVVINHAKTVGSGACAGCAGEVCLVVTSLKVTTPSPFTDVLLQSGTSLGSNMAHWQGSGNECLLVPVRSSTWGQVKALYR